MPDPDPLADLLRKAPLSDAQRAQLWDVYQAAATEDALAAALKPLKVPNPVKATLWDLKARTPVAAPPAASAPPGLEGSALERFASNAGAALNPVAMVTGLAHAVAHPIETVTNIGAAADAEIAKSKDAYRQGRYSEAVGHGVASVIPVIGPAAAAAGEQIGSGDVAGGLGAGVGLIGSILAPEAITKAVKSVPVVPRVGKNVPPPVAEAVEFGLREGVPVDVATATQNRYVRGAQKLAEESAGGSVVGERAHAAQADALTATGERLTQRASPQPVTPEQAGQAVRDAVTARAAAYDAAADVGYSKLRTIEAARGIAVDLKPTQAALRPIYEALKREAELVPLMGDKARALTALDRLMSAPDMAPLSVADAALGELKAMSRVDQAFRRTTGQGVAAEAVRTLEQQVRAGAVQAGPDAFRALMDGRAATVNKFKTIDVLDKLQTEPVGVFNQATWAKDAGIARLRELARIAPAQVKQIGRAWLENAMTKATAEGGFGRAQGLLADWQRLGPQTKQLIFRDAAHVKDLDNFFLLAKKMAENPNPSGTALTLAKGGEAGLWFANPVAGATTTIGSTLLAKLLLSPRTTRLVLQGLRLPVSATKARALWAGELGRLLQEQAPGAIPAVADQAPAR